MLRFLWVFAALCGGAVHAIDREQAEQELQQVKQQIAQQKQLIQQQKVDKKSLQNQLKQAEISIAKTAKTLVQTKNKLSANQQSISQLNTQQKELATEQRNQQAALAAQLRSAYLTGKHDYGKLLLNQQELGKLERMITYYSYLNRARIGNLDQIKATTVKLQKVNTQLVEEKAELTQLLNVQQHQQQKIQLQQTQRKQTLVALNKKLTSGQQQLTRLIEDEKNLVKLLEEVTQLVSGDIELTGLKKLKGKLPWPTNGRVRHRFGKRKQGQVKWKGLYITGREGSSIFTVHQGRVLYADWLKGFGLLMVIDHGDGYMSLYGHNQALLKSAGDTVEAGEPVALLGQSGGQSRAGLYFEIRYRGKPLNPSRWLEKT